jgi:hypothetical protein
MAPELLILKAPIKKRCLRRLLYNYFFKAKKRFFADPRIKTRSFTRVLRKK